MHTEFLIGRWKRPDYILGTFELLPFDKNR